MAKYNELLITILSMRVGLKSKQLTMNDIKTKDDVTFLVTSFYKKVVENENLNPFFTHIDWDTHLPKMIHFWSFVLIDEPGYSENVPDKHSNLNLKKEHFEIWLNLFHETVNELFAGEKADIAHQRADTIAWTISNKLNIK
jgi:hemoglobin